MSIHHKKRLWVAAMLALGLGFSGGAWGQGAKVLCANGSKVIYASDRDGSGHSDLFLQNADGSGTPVNLTPNTPGSSEREPHCGSTLFSANKVVFQSDRDGNAEIYRVNTDGTGLVRLTFHAYADENPQWCGDQIVFTRDLLGRAPCGAGPQNPGSDYQLHVVGPEGEALPGGKPARALTCAHNVDPAGADGSCAAMPLTAAQFYRPTCRSDGAGGWEIAFSGHQPALYAGREIFRMPLCASGCCADGVEAMVQLTATAPTVDDDEPNWSPGGRVITFFSNRPSAADGSTEREIYAMDALDGTDVQALTARPVGGRREAKEPWAGP